MTRPDVEPHNHNLPFVSEDLLCLKSQAGRFHHCHLFFKCFLIKAEEQGVVLTVRTL